MIASVRDCQTLSDHLLPVDLLLHGAARDEAVHNHGALLADAVRPGAEETHMSASRPQHMT